MMLNVTQTFAFHAVSERATLIRQTTDAAHITMFAQKLVISNLILRHVISRQIQSYSRKSIYCTAVNYFLCYNRRRNKDIPRPLISLPVASIRKHPSV